MLGKPVLTGLAAVVILMATGLAAPAADDSPQGSWAGNMRQVNIGNEQSYPMTISLSGSRGQTDYPSLSCGGQLSRLATANGHTVYSETISYGRVDPNTGRGCIDGFIVVREENSSLILEWSGTYRGEPYVATAVLPRSK